MWHKVLLDIDGVVLQDSQPIPGADKALAFLRKEKIPFCYLTNRTITSRKTIWEELRVADPFVTEEMILTPATIARDWMIKKKASCKLYVPESLKKDFEGVTESDAPEWVVLADIGDAFDYGLLNEIFHYLFEGAQLLALHRNRYWLKEGRYHLDLGAFVTALEYASQKEALVVGKPSPPYFEAGLTYLSAKPHETIMVGDDVESDIGGAKKLGMKGVLVQTGKFRKDTLERADPKPDAILPSLEALPGFLKKLS